MSTAALPVRSEGLGGVGGWRVMGGWCGLGFPHATDKAGISGRGSGSRSEWERGSLQEEVSLVQGVSRGAQQEGDALCKPVDVTKGHRVPVSVEHPAQAGLAPPRTASRSRPQDLALGGRPQPGPLPGLSRFCARPWRPGGRDPHRRGIRHPRPLPPPVSLPTNSFPFPGVVRLFWTYVCR